MQHYDIIPDIHGDSARLTATLSALGYRAVQGVPTHPEGRIAAFLGDFIDTGSDNAGVIATVRTMLDAGSAVAIMGNHELNAILMHTPGANALGTDDGYMRARTADNLHQHESFLAEFPFDAPQTRDVIDWFMTLPLFLDLGQIRLVHACWNEREIDAIKSRHPDARLRPSDLAEIALEQGTFATAVLTSLKGPEMALPDGVTFRDHKGKHRSQLRLKWWAKGVRSWREAALSVPEPRDLPDAPLTETGTATFYPDDAQPVFFGHYKLTGKPMIDAPNIACLDYPEQACAYRWRGETNLLDASILHIPSPLPG